MAGCCWQWLSCSPSSCAHSWLQASVAGWHSGHGPWWPSVCRCKWQQRRSRAPAGLLQTGRRSDVPCRVVWVTRQQWRRLGRTRFRFCLWWFHKGFPLSRAWGWSLPVLAGAGSWRPQTHTLLKWVLVLPIVFGFVGMPNAFLYGVCCSEHGWALLEILGLVRAQDCIPEGAAGNRRRWSRGAGEDGEVQQCPLSPPCLQGEQWQLHPCCPALPSGSASRAAAWGNKTL